MFLTFCTGIVGEIKKLKRTRQTETNLMVLLNFFNGFSFLKNSPVENSCCHVFCVLRTQNTEHRTRRPEHRTRTTKETSLVLRDFLSWKQVRFSVIFFPSQGGKLRFRGEIFPPFQMEGGKKFPPLQRRYGKLENKMGTV